MRARAPSWRLCTEPQGSKKPPPHGRGSETEIAKTGPHVSASGKVFLVGAGPGDPDLITVRGLEVLNRATVVLYDNLANAMLLDLAPETAERIYVGKKKAAHSVSQEEICAVLLEKARAGHIVVRLKGGDPFIFGRGGEEAEALAEAGIPFEVVPGVTAALGIAAYTGVPLTHRGHTSAVSFVSGHNVDIIDWTKVGQSETLVIYMGLTSFPDIARNLIANGRSPDTPAMAVRWATRPDQVRITGTIATLPRLIEERRMKPPATIVVGEVVQLGARLNWFERLPLFGQTIVVTRAASQAGDLSARLRSLGACVRELPAIQIGPPADSGALDAAIAHLSDYDWILFTSVNGVRFFLEALDRSHVDLRSLRARICTIGPATRRAVEELHLKVDLTPEVYVAESLVASLATADVAGQRILLPRAAVARDLVPAELSRMGAHVDVVEAYRTTMPESMVPRARELFGSGTPIDWITVTSSSTVKNLVCAVGAETLRGIKLASIGPVTSATARELGLEATVEANPYTIDGLVEAIRNRSR